MTKMLLTAAPFLFCSLVYSQSELPDNFKIGNSFEIYSNDSLKVYFNCVGRIQEKKCADFYRVGKMDSVILNFTGAFVDYYLSGALLFKATMINNSIEGYAAYYHENGKISEEGNYNNNLRTGKWTYYYSSGQIEKIYSWEREEPIVLEAYKKDGTATVINGNGEISTEFRNHRQCDGFKAWGSVVNGKKNGKWKFQTFFRAGVIATETYQEGVFVNGTSNNGMYTKNPQIKLSKYYPNEENNLFENSVGCPGDRGIFFWKYEGEWLTSEFYPKLQEEVSSDTNKVKNQWLAVGIKISEDDVMKEINVRSSINDTELENRIYAIIKKMTKWKTAAVNGSPIESNIYFSILVDNNQVIILPDYIYKNR